MNFASRDDAYGVHAIQSQTHEETVTVLSVQLDVWILWDSGRVLTTCGLQDFDGVPMTNPRTLARMEASTGTGVQVYGSRTVHFTTDEGESLSITFQVSNVARPILAAGAFLDADCSVSMDGDNKVVIIPGGSVIKVVRWFADVVAETQEVQCEPRASIDTGDGCKVQRHRETAFHAVELDEGMESSRLGTSSGSLDPSRNGAHSQVDGGATTARLGRNHHA